jgi:transcriptional regulator with XRE-family HTH domain
MLTVKSDLERAKHNASVDLLDRLAIALSVNIATFFVEPPVGDTPPEALKAGRKPQASWEQRK